MPTTWHQKETVHNRRVNEEASFPRRPRMLLSPRGLFNPGSHCLSKELHASLVCPDGCHRPFLGAIPGSSPQEEEGPGLEQSSTSDKASLPFSPGCHLSKLHPWLRGKLYRLRAPAPNCGGETGTTVLSLLSLQHTTRASPGDDPPLQSPP